jgi:hypothetical protein
MLTSQNGVGFVQYCGSDGKEISPLFLELEGLFPCTVEPVISNINPAHFKQILFHIRV